MSVIPSPYNNNILKNQEELKRFILACHKKVPASSQAEIISISTQIDTTDPLFFLATKMRSNDLSFYWENQRKKESVVGIGNVKSLQIDSGNRFTQSQNFVDDYKSKIFKVGDIEDNKFPYFFSYFSFFNEEEKYNQCFPLAKIFIPSLQLVNKEDKSLLIINILKDNIEEQITLLEPYFNEVTNIKNNGYNSSYQSNLNKLESDNQVIKNIDDSQYDSFTANVNQALMTIRQRKLNKIVVTHALELESSNNFNIIESLANLRQKHPDCYIFLVSNNKEDYFIGASPERLLSIQDHQLVTDALAGSSARGDNDSDDQFYGEVLLNSDKEKREHDAVTNFIIQCLSELELSPKKASLQLLKLSNIQHLWTPIYAQISSHLKPLQIISKLHPTPAVAGVPIKIACEEIKNQETFDRSLYAAPLGWIDTNGNCEFIVGIRSALIQKNKARLYAGAGIVYGSNPQQELAEIKLKFQALLEALV